MWCQMVAIVYKAECVHKMNIICTISSNYLNLVEPKRRFVYLVFVWIQCIICSAECVVIYAPICVYVSGNPRQVTNTQHIARACVLVCWCVGDELYDHHIICAIIVALRLVCHSQSNVFVPTAYTYEA